MLKKLIEAIKKEFTIKAEETVSGKIDRGERIIQAIRNVIENMRAEMNVPLGLQEKVGLIEDYWKLELEQRKAVEQEVSRLLCEMLEKMYSLEMKGDDSQEEYLRELLELQRLFDPGLNHLKEVVLSDSPVFERLRIKDGYLACPRGAEILNAQDAAVSKNACIVGFEDRNGFKGIGRDGDSHVFIILTDKEDITGEKDREQINKMCEEACPGLWDTDEDGGIIAGYYMVPEHGDSRLKIPNPDHSYYGACADRYIGNSHLMVEYPNGGIMIFRDGTAGGQEE